jgi:hypothetical protein
VNVSAMPAQTTAAFTQHLAVLCEECRVGAKVYATSSVVNLGPYAFPDVVLLKICPSSPWYANESGSQPGILLKATFGPEKPMPIMRLDDCQFCYPVLRAFTNPSLPFDMTVVS